MNNRTNQIWNLFAFRRRVVCIRETTVPTKYGNRSLFFVVVCIRDDRIKLLASVGLAQARPGSLRLAQARPNQ